MCGIDGIFSKDNLSMNTIKKMNNCMIHRGPHNEGIFQDQNLGLGMRRLKVIDLEGGNQPLFNETKDVIVMFNGEIFNFESLRDNLKQKGHKFISKTDTEVLVHGYEQWGIDELLARLNGMFAFSIYDKKKRKIFVCRDRLGEKPLYYFYNSNDFIFGSELKTLLESEKIPRKISKLSLYFYLSLHYVPGDMCIIKDVKKLLPGHYMEFNLDKFSLDITQYWELEEKNFEEKTLDDYLISTKKIIEDSVRIRMNADVPIGLFLSGGIDSSVIALVMKNLTDKVNTFSIGFSNSDFDESRYSKLVAEKFGTIHHHFVLEPPKILDLLPNVIKYMDEPCGDQALLPVYWLSSEAKKYVTVVLSGEGSDEIFGGYEYYKNDNQDMRHEYFSEFFLKNPNETLSGFPLISDDNIRFNLITNFNLQEIVEEMKNFQWYDKLKAGTKKIKNKLRLRQYVDIKSWLPDDLLMKFDKMTMSQSLEGRAPFLDYRLVEFVYNLPPNYKINNDEHKFILKEAFTNNLPKEITERKKQGFNLPMSEWLKTHLLDLFNKLISVDIDDGLNNEFVKKLLDEHLSGTDRGRLLYSILIYKLWIQNLHEKI